MSSLYLSQSNIFVFYLPPCRPFIGHFRHISVFIVLYFHCCFFPSAVPRVKVAILRVNIHTIVNVSPLPYMLNL